jgi:hypothetical protein
MWSLITQSCNQSSGGSLYLYEKENFRSYGALVGALLDSAGSALKSLMALVTLHQSQPVPSSRPDTLLEAQGEPPPPHKDDAQALLEAVYRSQLIGHVIETFRCGTSTPCHSMPLYAVYL